MKLAFKNRRMQFLAAGAVVLGLLASPAAGFAGEPAQQQQPKPDQSEKPQQQAKEFTKTIKKEFSITPTGTVDLSNKYGKVNVNTWERDRVKIDVTIVVDARSESSAQDVFDRIDIDFSNDNDYVKAETTIESTTSWWGGTNNRSEFQVNYQVFMPESCNLKLSNKYGDSQVDAISGKANIIVKYGNFELEGVGGELQLYLGYGNGTVVKARNVDAEVSYSKLNLNNVQDIDFSTKYSKLYVDKAASVKAASKYDQFSLDDIDRFNCESRYGNVEIGTARNVVATARYTDYRIENLTGSGDFNLEYGGLRIENLAKNFEDVEMTGKYSNFKLYIEPGAVYSLDGAASYSTINYPPAMEVTYEKDRGTSHEVKGNVGGNGGGVIKANLRYGGLKVRRKQ